MAAIKETTITLRELILMSAQKALTLQKKDGTFPSGHNGPWNNSATPVRLTSHWSLLFLKAFELTHDSLYKEAAERACSYLTSVDARPNSFSFYCAESENKIISCNGLIGQAWTLEALIEAYKILRDSRYLDVAHDVLIKHPFNEPLSLWHILAVDGEKLQVHSTLNQQLWFFIMSYKVAALTNRAELRDHNTKFLAQLPYILKFNSEFIGMLISERHLTQNFLSFAKLRMRNALTRDEYTVGQGYLAFTLSGLATLYLLEPNLSLWGDSGFKKKIAESLQYLEKSVFNLGLNQNKYAFPYNPVGFEAAYITESFGSYLSPAISPEVWVKRQLDDHYDFNEHTMSKNTEDPQTLSARFYELCSLQNLDLTVKVKPS
ncbi:MAG: hypothetical protein NWF04_03865 [Candidatus Bathyarchaeota archaeon]|nr:hypothetical protein [Candidatus Bathyarchaeota archaeon]